MSNDIAEPRRTGRERKQVEKFEPKRNQNGKGKGRAVDNQDSEEDSENESSEEDDGSEEEEHRRAPKKAKRAVNGTKKVKAATAPAPKRPRKQAAPTNGEAGPAEVQGENFKTDSAFFNALLSADIALAPLVEDWVENYQTTTNDDVSERAAIHELILFVIRACGLAADVTEDEAMDVDGVPEAVDTIQEESVRVAAAAYPLISKTKILKPFKANLDLFVSLLIKTMAISDTLYEEAETTTHTLPLISILLTWLNTMSSSPLRPIRHTSTYIALKIVTELCVQAGDIGKELNLKQRQKDMEAKKGGVGPAFQKKMKEAEAKVKEVHGKKVRLEEIMKDSFDTLFVHRVRDADPNIRTDCLKELGVWVRKYPDLYTGNSFLQYLSRGTNDPNSHARLESVKAFASLLSKDAFITNARTNIMRISSRLIEISLRDVDTNVRIHALKALALLDKTGVLQDEDDDQRNRVVRVVFDQEPRVRRAVGEFVKGLLAEKVEGLESTWSAVKGTKKKRGSKISEKDMRTYLGWKALATMLVETYHELDSREVGTSTAPSVPVSVSMGRATAAVEALRGSIEGLSDWHELVDYLLLDHSTGDQDMWLLEDEEEDFMIQVLIACIRADAAEDEENRDEQTKALMKVYPRLLSKHQADVGRMSALLMIPSQMNLGLYLDMRMTSAYDSLWDDIIKQFLQHTDQTVLTSAIQAINELTLNTSLSNNNTAKLNELTESLFTSLRDAINGQDVSSMSIDDEEVVTIQAILFRLTLLAKSRDITEVMEDEEGGQSSGWEIVCAFAERGELPYKDEAKIIEYAIQAVFLHLTWMFKGFTVEDKDDPVKILALNEKRDRAVEIFQKLALKELSNAPISVKRQAFIAYVNVHILFSSKSENALPAAQACPLVMPSEIQSRLGGAFQAAVERYATDKEINGEEESQADNDDFSPEKASSEIQFLQLVAVFVGAIRCGVLDSDHAKEPLAHCGRFGATYDAVVKKLVDVLRDEGIYNRDSDTVVAISVEALQASFNFFLDTEALEPTAPLVLTKLLASAFTIHGNHFTVLKHLHPNDAQDFHTESIEAAFARVSTYVKQERQATRKDGKALYARKRAQVLTIFKCLIQLLGPVNGRGALNIKSEMENGLREIGIEVSGNRMWEGYRAYEKRLVLIASKDSNIRAGAARVVEGLEHEQEVEREGTEIGSPTPRATGEEVEVELPDLDDEEEVDPADGMDFDLGDLENGNGDEEEEEPVTPSNGKRRSVAGSERPNKKSKSRK